MGRLLVLLQAGKRGHICIRGGLFVVCGGIASLGVMVAHSMDSERLWLNQRSL